MIQFLNKWLITIIVLSGVALLLVTCHRANNPPKPPIEEIKPAPVTPEVTVPTPAAKPAAKAKKPAKAKKKPAKKKARASDDDDWYYRNTARQS